jgi:hypothetical protein
LIPSPVDTSFYFLSEMPDQRIRQVSRDGEILRAFGEDLEPPDPSWRVYNQGFLCITASRQLIFVSQFGPLVEKYNLEGELMASVPYLEEQYERSVEATKRERRQTGMQNIIGSFFDGAYVTPGSNEVYIVKGAYLFYVIDTTTMQMIREIQVTNPDHEHPIMFFCVVKPEGSENGPIIYGLEFMTNGIKKLVPEHQRRCALSPGSASDR